MVLGGHQNWHRPHAGQSSSVYRQRARGLRLWPLSPVCGAAVGVEACRTGMAMVVRVSKCVVGCAAGVVSGQAV